MWYIQAPWTAGCIFFLGAALYSNNSIQELG